MNVDVEIENLLSEVTIKQVYSNLEKVNIEAVYTFPLPLDAVLLDMTIKTKTKELQGVVIEKKEAEDRYEDAIPCFLTISYGSFNASITALDTLKRFIRSFRWFQSGKLAT